MICEYLWNEYELLYTTYENFNDQSLTLKSWSATVGLAAILAVYSDKIGSSARIAVIAAALSAIPFWVIDAFWKSYQNAFLARIEDLEKIVSCTKDSAYRFGIVTDWQDAHNWYDWLTVLHMPNVALPHVFTLLLGLYLAWKHPPGSSR